MVTISFQGWQEVLAGAELPEKVQRSHTIIIQWYLGYLRETGQGASVSSARAFVEGLMEERRPAAWMVERWREGLNWFFRHAPVRRRVGTAAGVAGEREDRRRRYEVTVAELQARVPPDPLFDDTVRLMRVRHMAYRTEVAYLGWLRRLESYFRGKKTLDELGEEELKQFLSYLAVEEGVSAATQRQALNAGVFFLREVCRQELGDFSDYVQANPRKYYPVVYAREEIKQVLEAMQGRWRLMARLQYGCGLRISELCRVRVKDVDLSRGKLYIRAGKGDKDRCVPLPVSLREDLQGHLEGVRGVYEKDRAQARAGVSLPNALDRKMPKAGERWEWFWVFPANDLSLDPRGDSGVRRRHHILPGVYQRRLSEGVRAAGIPKRSNSHILRHSYATHLLENGTNIRTVQEFLGHACVETTMIYLHVMEDQRERTVSPLDAVAVA